MIVAVSVWTANDLIAAAISAFSASRALGGSVCAVMFPQNLASKGKTFLPTLVVSELSPVILPATTSVAGLKEALASRVTTLLEQALGSLHPLLPWLSLQPRRYTSYWFRYVCYVLNGLHSGHLLLMKNIKGQLTTQIGAGVEQGH